jgi:glycosyltransferase involved in cell wall biosynthesis
MSTPLVSTITPCFRMGRYLKGFLEALPAQTYFDRLEIVLDHNEPDPQEVEWVRAFQKRYPGRLKHIIVDKVDPIGISMNRCIQEAAGDFVAIWNVDDLRTADSIAAQASLLLDRSEVSIAYGDYLTVSSFGATAGAAIRHSNVPESEFTRSMIFGPFFMFRKSLCARGGYFDEQLRSGADFDLCVRLALHGKAAMTQQLLGFYLNEGLGASTRPNSLQPVERTVIELRYGIYDKVDYAYLPAALRYDVYHLWYRQQKLPLSTFVPEYQTWIENRKRDWLDIGLRNYCNRMAESRGWVQKSVRMARAFVGSLRRKPRP